MSARQQEWVYVEPQKFRDAIEHYKAEIALNELILASVERGEVVVTGESPVVDRFTSYFTCREPRANPFAQAEP